MACYTPLKAYRTRTGINEYNITFNANDPNILHSLSLNCGSCIGCKKRRARDWAIRCTHEAQMHDDNMFITLTYSDEHLPNHWFKNSDTSQKIDAQNTLNHRDFQLFMKKLRRRIDYSEGKKVKYFMCGEYGEKLQRPHYHLCLFGYKFPDYEFGGNSKTGDKVYTSKILQDLWEDKGFANFGDVSFQSASYVAGYIDKKITGSLAKDHYGDRCPEYTTCSNGIGKTWFERYYRDVYNFDKVTVLGKDGPISLRPPRYYDKLFEEIAPKEMEDIKQSREESAFLLENHPDNSKERLLSRYQVALLGKNQFDRNLGEIQLDSKVSSNYIKDSLTIKHLKNY